MNWKGQELEGNTYDLIEILLLVETTAKDKISELRRYEPGILRWKIWALKLLKTCSDAITRHVCVSLNGNYFAYILKPERNIISCSRKVFVTTAEKLRRKWKSLYKWELHFCKMYKQPTIAR
jgi:hypothetical protein